MNKLFLFTILSCVGQWIPISNGHAMLVEGDVVPERSYTLPSVEEAKNAILTTTNLKGEFGLLKATEGAQKAHLHFKHMYLDFQNQFVICRYEEKKPKTEFVLTTMYMPDIGYPNAYSKKRPSSPVTNFCEICAHEEKLEACEVTGYTERYLSGDCQKMFYGAPDPQDIKLTFSNLSGKN